MKLKNVLQTTDADIALILHEDEDDMPPVMLPVSDRARTLFITWGMEEKGVSGIIINFAPDDMVEICPKEWKMVLADIGDGDYIFQEITLPDLPVVVH